MILNKSIKLNFLFLYPQLTKNYLNKKNDTIYMETELELVTIEISAETYSGYQYKIPKSSLQTMSQEEIITEVKTHMTNFFRFHNLHLLENGVRALNLHFHEEITSDKDIIYLCAHCK